MACLWQKSLKSSIINAKLLWRSCFSKYHDYEQCLCRRTCNLTNGISSWVEHLIEKDAFSSRPSTIWGQESSALASNFWTVIREVGFGMKSPLMHSTNRVTYAIVNIRARSKSKPWSKHSPGRGELDSPNFVCKINAPLPKSKPSLCFK